MRRVYPVRHAHILSALLRMLLGRGVQAPSASAGPLDSDSEPLSQVVTWELTQPLHSRDNKQVAQHILERVMATPAPAGVTQDQRVQDNYNAIVKYFRTLSRKNQYLVENTYVAELTKSKSSRRLARVRTTRMGCETRRVPLIVSSLALMLCSVVLLCT